MSVTETISAAQNQPLGPGQDGSPLHILRMTGASTGDASAGLHSLTFTLKSTFAYLILGIGHNMTGTTANRAVLYEVNTGLSFPSESEFWTHTNSSTDQVVTAATRTGGNLWRPPCGIFVPDRDVSPAVSMRTNNQNGETMHGFVRALTFNPRHITQKDLEVIQLYLSA